MDKIKNLVKLKTSLIPIVVAFAILLAAYSITNFESAAAQMSGQTRIAASSNIDSKNASLSVGVYTNPQLAFSDNTNHAFVIWNEMKSTSLISSGQNAQGPINENHTSNLYYRVSGDNGKSFGRTISLGNFSQSQVLGPITASEENGTNAYAVWAANATDNDYNLYFSRTSTDSSSFERPTLVATDHFAIATHNGNNSSVVSGIVEPQIIATSHKHVFLLWNDETTKITYSNKTSTSANPIPPPSFSGTVIRNGSMQQPQSSVNPQIQNAPPSYETSIQTYFLSSSDGGKTFSPKVSILNQSSSSNGTLSLTPIPPRLAASGTNVYIVSTQFGAKPHDSEVILEKSQNNGKTFEKSQIVIPGYNKSNEGTTLAIPYAVAGANGNESKSLYIDAVISENTSRGQSIANNLPILPFPSPINPQLRFHNILLHSANEGATFSNPVEILNESLGQGFPIIDLSTDGSHVYIARIDTGNVSSASQGYPFLQPFSGGAASSANSTAGSILVSTISGNATTLQSPILLKDSKSPSLSLSFDFGGGTFQLLHAGSQGVFIVKEASYYNSSSGSGFSIPESRTLVWSSTDGGHSFVGPSSIVQPLDSQLVSTAVFYPHGSSNASLFLVWEGNGGAIYLQKFAAP